MIESLLNESPSGNVRMSFRDYCAAIALGVWVQAHIDQSVDDLDKQTIARECFSYASAMVDERRRIDTPSPQKDSA